MKIRGRAWKFGDDVNTDLIIPGRYLELTDPMEMAGHVMEGIDQAFPERIGPGDIVVAGRNFGMGSSREHAPLAIKYAGVGAVVAESFARIFYRNSINIGLPSFECRGIGTSVNSSDTLEIDQASGLIKNVTSGVLLRSKPFPGFIVDILSEGGLASYIRRRMDEWLK